MDFHFQKISRLLAKLTCDSQVRGAYGTEDRSVLNIHEDLSTGATKQLAAEGEFCKKPIKKASFQGVLIRVE